MKLNLTEEYVLDSNYVFENGHMICGYFEARDIGEEFMGEEIEPEIAIKDLQNFQDDWLAMYAELKVRAELIEKLADALYISKPYINIENNFDDYKTFNSTLSAVEEWRKK